MKIGIMTDVNAGLDYVKYNYPITCLRSSVNFKNEILVDGIDIRADEFYERLQKVKSVDDIPSTSAASLDSIDKAIEKFIELGYTDIIFYPISFELSSLGPNVLAMVPDYADRIKIHVVNSKCACYLQGYITLEAARMASEGANVDEIIAHSKKLIANMKAVFVVEDLSYLVKNGRLSGAQGFLGGLLKIKPILELTNEGKIVTLEKVRIYHKAVSRLIEIVLEFIEGHQDIEIFCIHSLKLDTVEEIIKKIKEARPDITKIDIHYITPAVGAHIGSGVVGVGAFLK